MCKYWMRQLDCNWEFECMEERGREELALSGAGDKGERTILLLPLEKREICNFEFDVNRTRLVWTECEHVFVYCIYSNGTYICASVENGIDPTIRIWFRFVATYVFWFLILLSFRYHLFFFARFGRRQYFFGFAFTRLRSTFSKNMDTKQNWKPKAIKVNVLTPPEFLASPFNTSKQKNGTLLAYNM